MRAAGGAPWRVPGRGDPGVARETLASCGRVRMSALTRWCARGAAGVVDEWAGVRGGWVLCASEEGEWRQGQRHGPQLTKAEVCVRIYAKSLCFVGVLAFVHGKHTLPLTCNYGM